MKSETYKGYKIDFVKKYFETRTGGFIIHAFIDKKLISSGYTKEETFNDVKKKIDIDTIDNNKTIITNQNTQKIFSLTGIVKNDTDYEHTIYVKANSKAEAILKANSFTKEVEWVKSNTSFIGHEEELDDSERALMKNDIMDFGEQARY